MPMSREHRRMAEAKTARAKATPVTTPEEARVLQQAEAGRMPTSLPMAHLCAQVGWLGQGWTSLTPQGQAALDTWRAKQ